MKKLLTVTVLVLSLLLIPSVVGANDNTGGNISDNQTITQDIVKPTPAPSPSGDGGGGGGGYIIRTNLFGVERNHYTERNGNTLSYIKGTSQNGKLTITIPKRTTALEADGKRLKTLEVVINENPPEPPEDNHIIGLTYDFGPAGANFEPPIALTWSYDSDNLPEGVVEEDLVLAYYIDGEWVELECVVDTDTNTITASVSHFTTFAIIEHIVVLPEPTPVVMPPPPVPVMPELAKPAPPIVTPAPEPESLVLPEKFPSIVEPAIPESVPTVPVTEPSTSYWVVILGSVIACVIVIVVLWLMRNRIKRLWQRENDFSE